METTVLDYKIEFPRRLNDAPAEEWTASALKTQVGGSHYKKHAIQPVEYIHANGLGFCEGNVVKYVSRWQSKGGLDDLRKAKHFIELLIEMEEKRMPKTGDVTLTPPGKPVSLGSREDWEHA